METHTRTIYLQEGDILQEAISVSNVIPSTHPDEDVTTVYITEEEDDPEVTASLAALPSRLLHLWQALFDDDDADCLVVGRDGAVRFPRLVVSTLAKGIDSIAVGEDGKVPKRILTTLPTLTVEHCKSLMRDGIVTVGSAEVADAIGFLRHFFNPDDLDCDPIGEPAMRIKLPGIAATIERVMGTLDLTKVFADTIIWCTGDTKLLAHWCILRVMSSLFSKVPSPRLLVFSHTKPSVVTQILHLLYTGEEINGGAYFIQEIQECARVFGIKSLMRRHTTPGPSPDWAVRRLTSASHASEQVKMLADLHEEGTLHDAAVYSQQAAIPIHRLAFGLHSRFKGLIPSLLRNDHVPGCHDLWFLDVDQDTLEAVVDCVYKGQDYDLRKVSVGANAIATIPCYKPVDDNTPLATRQVEVTFADIERKEFPKGPRYVKMACDYCGYIIRSDQLAAHVRRHTGERPFVCAECGKDFTSLPTQRSHSGTCHGPLTDVLECPLCDESVTRKVYSQHVMGHKVEKAVTCGKCNKAFPFESLCESHSELCKTTVIHECPFCSITFSTGEKLARHTQERHGEEVIRCRRCDTVFESDTDLLSHDCPNKPSKDVKTVYYACEECPKRFKMWKSLQHHMAMHSGQKPYPCEYCDKTFIRPESIKQHVNRFHKNRSGRITSRRKYFICYKCNDRFPRAPLFRQHNQEQHQGEEFPTLESVKMFESPAVKKRRVESESGDRTEEEEGFEGSLEEEGHEESSVEEEAESETTVKVLLAMGKSETNGTDREEEEDM